MGMITDPEEMITSSEAVGTVLGYQLAASSHWPLVPIQVIVVAKVGIVKRKKSKSTIRFFMISKVLFSKWFWFFMV